MVVAQWRGGDWGGRVEEKKGLVSVEYVEFGGGKNSTCFSVVGNKLLDENTP